MGEDGVLEEVKYGGAKVELYQVEVMGDETEDEGKDG